MTRSHIIAWWDHIEAYTALMKTQSAELLTVIYAVYMSSCQSNNTTGSC